MPTPEGPQELNVDTPLTLEHARRILGIARDDVVPWLVGSGKLAATLSVGDIFHVSYTAIEDYWRRLEKAGTLIESEREQGRRMFRQECAERQRVVAEFQLLQGRRVQEARARRAGLDRRGVQRREYARNWEHREPEQVLARLGEGALEERFTFAQAATILGVSQNHVYTFAAYARSTFGGDHPRRLQTARDDRRVYTTRRWLQEHVQHWEQHRADSRTNERIRLDALNEARHLEAEGVALYCNTCDVEIGWAPSEFGGTFSTLYCIACGTKEREARLAALGD